MTATVTQSPSYTIGNTQAPLPPLVDGLPILGSALDLKQGPIQFAVKNYHEHGSVFRAKAIGREMFFMAGIEANQIAREADHILFTNERQFSWIPDQLGYSLIAEEGDDHNYMRKLLKPAYSRVQAAQRIDVMTQIVDDFVDSLAVGDSFEVMPTMQELVVNQLGHVMLNFPVGDYFPDFKVFMSTMLAVGQRGTRPRWVYRLPFYRRAKARTFEMAEKVIEYIRSTDAGVDRPRTAIDIMLEKPDASGQPHNQGQLLAEAMSPYLAGQDTVAGTLSFLWLLIHKHPDVQERVTAEAREAFAPDMSVGDLRQLDDIHKTIVETMRRYPLGGLMPRHARCTFEFNGYRIPEGASVFSALAVTHFLPEYYEDPYTFDIDRPAGPNGTFSPYGLGRHTCLGAGIADVQLMVMIAAFLRRGRFQLDPVDYEMQLNTNPVPNPGHYRLKLVEKY